MGDDILRILVADDLPAMRHVIISALHEIGLKDAKQASDGIQALAELKRNKFDLLITDWNMPNMDGITLIRMIRGDPELKDLVILMLTAETDKDQVVKAMKTGLTDYIVKPFNAKILKSKIEKHFQVRLQVNE